MKLKMQNTVPPGVYSGRFTGAEETPANNDFGPGLKWMFEIINGPFAGRTVSRFTGVSPSQKNACGKILAGLTGQQLVEGQEIDLDRCVGAVVAVVVGLAASGSTRVETVCRQTHDMVPPQTAEDAPF